MSNHRNKIENTKAFQKMEGFKQKIYGNAANMKNLSQQYVQACNMGYDNWLAANKPNNVEREIIKELLS